jgi:hypothetical protein
MKERRCDQCEFWRIGDLNLEVDDDIDGTCHRFPPVLSDAVMTDQPVHEELTMEAHQMWVWRRPTVVASDWCGEFKPKESDGA